MSKKETPLLYEYWRQVKGTLIEEFVAVNKGKRHGVRLLDGVIIKGEVFEIKKQNQVEITGKDIIVVQVKASRLGMNLMGQVFFSQELMKNFRPKSIEAVALCTGDDEVLRPLLEKYPNLKVVVMKG
jgi:hypothetical protein